MLSRVIVQKFARHLTSSQTVENLLRNCAVFMMNLFRNTRVFLWSRAGTCRYGGQLLISGCSDRREQLVNTRPPCYLPCCSPLQPQQSGDHAHPSSKRLYCELQYDVIVKIMTSYLSSYGDD